MAAKLIALTVTVALGVGCSTGDAAPAEQPMNGGSPKLEDAAVDGSAQPVVQQPMAAKDVGPCIVASAGMRDAAPSETRLIGWDALTRVKSQHASAAADSPVKLAWRYDASGRVLAYAGFGPGTHDVFQHDYVYDDRGNPTDFKLTYPQAPDLSHASSAEVWMGTSYVNEYDAAGSLKVSTVTPYGPGNASNPAPIRTSFREDADGRCERLEITHQDSRNDWVELRTYDDAGRLHTIERDYAAGGAPFWRPCEAVLTIHEYNSLGQILSTTTRGAPGHGCDEQPFNTVNYEYAADGGVRIETIDYITDTPNDKITVNGAIAQVGHRIETRTPACASIEAQIAPRADTRCSVD